MELGCSGPETKTGGGSGAPKRVWSAAAEELTACERGGKKTEGFTVKNCLHRLLVTDCQGCLHLHGCAVLTRLKSCRITFGSEETSRIMEYN